MTKKTIQKKRKIYTKKRKLTGGKPILKKLNELRLESHGIDTQNSESKISTQMMREAQKREKSKKFTRHTKSLKDKREKRKLKRKDKRIDLKLEGKIEKILEPKKEPKKEPKEETQTGFMNLLSSIFGNDSTKGKGETGDQPQKSEGDETGDQPQKSEGDETGDQPTESTKAKKHDLMKQVIDVVKGEHGLSDEKDKAVKFLHKVLANVPKTLHDSFDDDVSKHDIKKNDIDIISQYMGTSTANGSDRYRDCFDAYIACTEQMGTPELNGGNGDSDLTKELVENFEKLNEELTQALRVLEEETIDYDTVYDNGILLFLYLLHKGAKAPKKIKRERKDRGKIVLVQGGEELVLQPKKTVKAFIEELEGQSDDGNKPRFIILRLKKYFSELGTMKPDKILSKIKDLLYQETYGIFTLNPELKFGDYDLFGVTARATKEVLPTEQTSEQTSEQMTDGVDPKSKAVISSVFDHKNLFLLQCKHYTAYHFYKIWLENNECTRLEEIIKQIEKDM